MHRVDAGEVAHAVAVAADVEGFGPKRVRQQNVGVAGRGRHHVVADNDEFAFRRVAQDLVGLERVGVLVDERVSARIHDHADVVRELFDTADAVVRGIHFGAAHDRVRPEEDRDRGLHLVFADRKIHRLPVRAVFFHAGRRAGEPHLTRENRKHRDGAGGLFAVGLALRPETLRDEAGLRRADFARERNDRFNGDPRDARGVFGGLGRTVGFAQDIGPVVALFGRALGERLFVVADAVLREERFVDPAVADQFVGDAFDECGVRARADRDPLVDLARHRVGVDRVDDDGLRVALLKRATELVALGAPRAAGDRRVVAEGDVELGVGDLLDTRSDLLAVGIGESGRNLRRRVRAVVLQIAAHDVHEALPGAAGVDERLLARAVLPVDGVGAVLFKDRLPARGDRFVSFFPSDAFEFGFAAFAHALHRVLETVGRVEALAHRAALQTGADLARLAAVLDGVVRFDADHAAVLRIDAKRAAVAAVDDACAPRVVAVVFNGSGNGTRNRQRRKAEHSKVRGAEKEGPAARARGARERFENMLRHMGVSQC